MTITTRAKTSPENAVGPPTGEVSSAEDLRNQLLEISDLVRDLAGEFELEPLLEKVLTRALTLLGYQSGSISLVDERAGTYTKKIDSGVICQEGLTFPLTEGFTGMVTSARKPVILDSYQQVPGGHISRDDPRYECAVMGSPLFRNDEVIGALVVFGETPGETFSEDEARLVELFARHATIVVINSQLHKIAADRATAVAVSEERERAAQNYRDSVSTVLTNLVVDLEQVAGQMKGSDDSVKQVMLRARELARDALTGSQDDRFTGFGLGTKSQSLEEEIAKELEWIEASTTLSTDFLVVGDRRNLGPEVHHHCFKVVEEALSNAQKHANATTVRVGLIFNSGSLSLVVEDNGAGFDVANAHRDHASLKPGCLGLHDMASRISRLNGDFSIDSTLGWGTTVRSQVFDSDAHHSDSVAPTRWKLVIATRMPLVSAGLIRLLNLHEPAIQVAAEIHSDDQFIETLNLVKPDIVAVDLAMVRDDFLEQLIALRQEQPNLPIIAITTNPTADELYASSRAGVRGFLRADAEPSTIVRTIVAAVQGNSLLEGSVLESLTDYLSADMLIDQPTQRELEVLRVIGEGQSNQEIASRLHISIKTVEKHVSSLLKKSGTKNRTMLANMYMQKLSRF